MTELLVGELAETWQEDVVNSVFVAGSAARPPFTKSDNGPVDRIQKVRFTEQGCDFVG